MAKLRWQCRRGTLELDKLLSDYLEHYYPQAAAEEQQLFHALLLCEDGNLLDWLLANKAPTAKKFEQLIIHIQLTAHLTITQVQINHPL